LSTKSIPPCDEDQNRPSWESFVTRCCSYSKLDHLSFFHIQGLQGVKKVPRPVLSLYLHRFITIPLHHTLTHFRELETLINGFHEPNRRRREALLNLPSLQRTLSTINGERGTKIRHSLFLDQRLGRERIHQELVTTLRDDAYGASEVKTWFQKFRNRDISCKDVPRPGPPPLTLAPQLRTFLEEYPFVSARVNARHFLPTVPTIRDIPQRELGMRKFSPCWASIL
jgi:hypothetical protein